MTTIKPWMNLEISPEERANLLAPELTLDEKMAQVSCYFPTDITATNDFSARYPHGIGEVSCLEARAADSLADVTDFQQRIQRESMENSRLGIPAIFHMEGLCGAYLPSATSFPSGIARGASWNPATERKIGEIVGRQERALGITHTLAPVLDVSRDPRMGRHGESYGEDACLTSSLGVEFTLGLQQADDEGRRTEAVAKHFVGSHHTEGGIHGSHCNVPQRTLLEFYAKPFQAAITLADLKGVMPAYNSVDGEPMSASAKLLTSLLREQMGFNGMLVSDYGAIGNLHSVQKVAESPAHAGVTALKAGLDVELHVTDGFGPELRTWFADGKADISLLDRAVTEVLTAKFRMGLFDAPLAPEASVRDDAFNRSNDAAIALESARESLVLLKNDGALPLKEDITKLAVIGCHAETARYFFGGYTHFSMAEGKLAFNSSMAGLVTQGEDKDNEINVIPGTSIEDSRDAQYEELLQFQQPGIRSLFEELSNRFPNADVQWVHGYPIAGNDESGHALAIALAAQSDVVIMTLGGKHGTASIASMGEGIDATDINLPPCQDSLIEKLAQLGKPLVGVHLDGRPISSDIADEHLDAILEAWSPAEAGAEAIVDVLSGKISPSGKLPVSVARNAGQVPIYYNHPHGSAWHQGASIGFPEYVDAAHTPRYRFGHGLTYTEFEYRDLVVSKTEVNSTDTVNISLNVTNIGNSAATEIVQLYASDRFASVSRPSMELLGFRRISLIPGEAATVEFQLDVSQLAFVGTDMQWIVESGDIDLLVGASSHDLRLNASLRIQDNAVVEGKSRGYFA